MTKKDDKNNRDIKIISVGKALTFAVSNAGMLLGFIFIGYIIGENWGALGKGIGVMTGAFIAIFLLLSEMMIFMLNFDKKEDKK